MDAGEATKYAAAGMSVIMAAAALYQQWASRQVSRDTSTADKAKLSAETRDRDLDRLYTGLREMITTLQTDQRELRATIDEHEETIERLRLENIGLRDDKAQLGSRVADQERTIARLTARMAELEAKSG